MRRAALVVVAVALVACARPQGVDGSVHPGPEATPERPPGEAPREPAAASSEPPATEPADEASEDFSSPDRDYDGDGIPDRDDACPTEPEVYDGGRDDDGCPGAA